MSMTMIGRTFAQRYQLEEFIGKGGMALVFRATDLRTEHAVAVKVLRPEFSQDAEFLERFQREALAASKMSHHNIVNLLDVGEEEGMRYLVIEYVRGRTLKDIIEENVRLRRRRSPSASSPPCSMPTITASSTGISSRRTC